MKYACVWLQPWENNSCMCVARMRVKDTKVIKIKGIKVVTHTSYFPYTLSMITSWFLHLLMFVANEKAFSPYFRFRFRLNLIFSSTFWSWRLLVFNLLMLQFCVVRRGGWVLKSPHICNFMGNYNRFNAAAYDYPMKSVKIMVSTYASLRIVLVTK